MGEGELTPEQLAEQIKALKVSDLLLSTVSTLGQLAYVKVDARQLDEARLAIDSSRIFAFFVSMPRRVSSTTRLCITS